MFSSMILIIIILAAILVYNLITRIRANRVATFVDKDQFKEGGHRGQIVDLRENRDFESGHILGARSIPYSTIKMFYKNIRKDMPVYLYDQGKTLSIKTAILLGKNGYKDIYILKSGFRNWNGRTKK
ncbi:rhodanese-like domain-containing protein [Apilactobacillus apinorum]|uniref:Rhodanese-like domain-containing protein n=2 Tax=Apilactobacillus apinorum TaxID=1218495 RepID=A0ABP9ZIS0_9LACO